MKIAAIHNSGWTAEALIASLLEEIQAGNIEAVVVVPFTKSSTLEYWSSTGVTAERCAIAGAYLLDRACRTARGED